MIQPRRRAGYCADGRIRYSRVMYVIKSDYNDDDGRINVLRSRYLSFVNYTCAAELLLLYRMTVNNLYIIYTCAYDIVKYTRT